MFQKLKLEHCPRCMWCSSVSSEQWYPVSNDNEEVSITRQWGERHSIFKKRGGEIFFFFFSRKDHRNCNTHCTDAASLSRVTRTRAQKLQERHRQERVEGRLKLSDPYRSKVRLKARETHVGEALRERVRGVWDRASRPSFSRYCRNWNSYSSDAVHIRRVTRFRARILPIHARTTEGRGQAQTFRSL